MVITLDVLDVVNLTMPPELVQRAKRTDAVKTVVKTVGKGIKPVLMIRIARQVLSWTL